MAQQAREGCTKGKDADDSGGEDIERLRRFVNTRGSTKDGAGCNVDRAGGADKIGVVGSDNEETDVLLVDKSAGSAGIRHVGSKESAWANALSAF
jgi:hypothetical protein